MAWNFSADKLIYMQIADRIIMSIISGEYAPGAQIPSVRQLALEAAVNPNTVQHAFTELENEGVIISKGTVGRYVTEDEKIIEKCRKKTAEQTIKAFAQNIQPLGLQKSEIIKMLEEELS
ncbi:MAG: GntR family transcriptional regulator [Ruminococcaceae bacterium]|nr:GntR family transcriptional regulator [Oscillospiraceae bacterium]